MVDLRSPPVREEPPSQPAYGRDTARQESGSLTELTHADRIATIGRLAASIPHEVNQPITAMVTNAQAALRLLDCQAPYLEDAVHQHGACIADSNHQDMGRSRGGLTSKIHAVVDTNGRLSRQVRRTTIGCVRFSSAPCFHKRCCSRIVDTTRTGSGSLPTSKEHGRTFRRNEIAKTRSALAR